jgi:uncharacterized protein YceK
MAITRILHGTLLAAVAGLLAGCATLSSKGNGSWGREYSGVRCVGTEDYWSGLAYALRGTQIIYSGTDYLFSAVMDTALLPIDLIVDGIEKLSSSSGAPPAPLCNDNSRHAS